ncbi:hypothetical protein HNY73_015348 [Argiope bruennichi]|uniref:Uncharacterized protein n=1 Tax=Argiope bruennichi TaxID=94029 RepID=A0A8T0EWH8_ARGBR|nr:hypothetical protein HNY73_015348 [Argiope bruennichi]
MSYSFHTPNDICRNLAALWNSSAPSLLRVTGASLGSANPCTGEPTGTGTYKGSENSLIKGGFGNLRPESTPLRPSRAGAQVKELIRGHPASRFSFPPQAR